MNSLRVNYQIQNQGLAILPAFGSATGTLTGTFRVNLSGDSPPPPPSLKGFALHEVMVGPYSALTFSDYASGPSPSGLDWVTDLQTSVRGGLSLIQPSPSNHEIGPTTTSETIRRPSSLVLQNLISGNLLDTPVDMYLGIVTEVYYPLFVLPSGLRPPSGDSDPWSAPMSTVALNFDWDGSKWNTKFQNLPKGFVHYSEVLGSSTLRGVFEEIRYASTMVTSIHVGLFSSY